MKDCNCPIGSSFHWRDQCSTVSAMVAPSPMDRSAKRIAKLRGPQAGSKIQILRAALVAGPMTTVELAEATGIDVEMVPSVLQWSLGNGSIKQLRDTKPFRYALAAPKAAAVLERPRGQYSAPIENQAIGQQSTERRAAIRRGGI